ncbi:MAG TPA: methyltransferase domain-containing protein [Acidimicrobiia bacterium]|nr:methyltransferase domain-containing protein [Acidimicrobiia bacterium]
MSAADSWRRQLEDWRIPDALLAAVEESPYGWTKQLWKRRAARAIEGDRTSPTLDVVRELANGGSVLDVGAGTGRASLPLVRDGYRVTMVEPNQAMLAGLDELEADVEFEVVVGRWPEVASEIQPHAVALSAHVVYDVAEVAPFLIALDRAATRGVVLELTPAHPWVNLGPLYRELHGLDRPLGPTVDDLAAVVREAVGSEPVVHRWTRPGDMVFDTAEEAIEFTARRLVLPRGRWPELEERLLPRLTGRAGHWQLEPTERDLCTLWWRSNSPKAGATPE